MLRKFVLTAAAAGVIGLAAFTTAPAQAGPLATTGLIAPQIETDVTLAQHWRWRSNRRWRDRWDYHSRRESRRRWR